MPAPRFRFPVNVLTAVRFTVVRLFAVGALLIVRPPEPEIGIPIVGVVPPLLAVMVMPADAGIANEPAPMNDGVPSSSVREATVSGLRTVTFHDPVPFVPA